MRKDVWHPMVQAGFAAFAASLLGLVTWLVCDNGRRVDQMIEHERDVSVSVTKLSAAVDANTRALEALLFFLNAGEYDEPSG